MNKNLLIKELNRMGYETGNHKFYKFRDKDHQLNVGMKVGQYTHSCDIESSDIYVFVCLKRNNNVNGFLYDIELQECWDMWVRDEIEGCN